MSNDAIPSSGYGPRRDDYGSGVYRRHIRVRCGEHAARADLEDDFHRFALVVEHAAGRVTAVDAAASRYPWTTCPGAIGVLRGLAGLELTESHAAVRAYSPPRRHCTHLFDLATLAVTCAARGDAGVDYQVEVPDSGHGKRVVRLRRDGRSALEWYLDGSEIIAPTLAPYPGIPLLGGFGRWAEASLEPREAEAALVLRRAIFIAMGRQFDFEQVEVATAFGAAEGTCHSFSRGVWDQAHRAHGTVRDFSDRPEALLREPLDLD